MILRKWIRAGLLGGVLGLAVAVVRPNAAGWLADASEPAAVRAGDEPVMADDPLQELARVNRLVARKALPAVVHVITVTQPAEQSGELPPGVPQSWRRFLDRPRQGVGSGVIVDAGGGFILTNNHVVEDASSITVHLHDGRRCDAALVAADPQTDLAVIRITADNLSQLPLGDSDVLEVGDLVMTVGNPFGMEGTVSQGIVSALNRSTSAAIIDYEGFIQTDAVINPGNSGGPLINMRAEIVGLNTAIQTSTGGFNGIGLAIPASRISKVLPALLRGEPVIRGFLGVSMTPALDNPDIAVELGWDQLHGIIIERVLEHSPAEEAGLLPRDILVNWDGEPVRSTIELMDKIAYTPPGAETICDVFRNQRMVSLQVVIGRQREGFSTRPLLRPQGQPSEPEWSGLVPRSADLPALGMAVQVIDEPLTERYHLQQISSGVVVTAIEPRGEAARCEIQPGDVIVALNGMNIVTVKDLEEGLEQADTTRPLDLRLRNSSGSRHVRLRVAY